MDLPAYFDRIGYAGPAEPTLPTLRALHRAHLLAVPFENLDIGLKRPIVLDEEKLVEKIVTRRRGGFCYEMNGVFAAALRQIGFRVTLLSARVPGQEGKLGPEFDHLTLRVDLEQPCLADVGFGREGFFEPLPLVEGVERTQRGVAYRLRRQDERWLAECRSGSQDWVLLYDFTLIPRQLADFAPMCRWHQSSPESHFTRGRMCSRLTPDGRLTLSGLKLIVTTKGEREERDLAGEEEFRAVLRERFGVVL
jgi:N-hydroxyarylamine O-acetyltransferase